MSPEHQVIVRAIARHQGRMALAEGCWPGQPICPDCYHPLKYHDTDRRLVACELALVSGVIVAKGLK